VTDVETTVLDCADAAMLSGETAAEKYPLKIVMAVINMTMEADTI
jgi:pyruvate kinase